MRHLCRLGALLGLLLGGCSLIVSGKLDEKGDGGARLPDGGHALTVKGERGKPYVVIGERLQLTSTNPAWKNAKAVRLVSGEGTVPCPSLGFEKDVLRCAIPSLTPEGKTTVTVVDGTGTVLGGGEVEVRRLVLVGGPEQAVVRLYTSDPFEEDGTIDLKQVLTGTAPPLLSPSGRYILGEVGPGLSLLDLVLGTVHPLTTDTGPCKSIQSAISVSPHSFEPRYGVIAREPQLPVIQHLPEDRVWVVDDQYRLRVFEIASILAGKPSGTVKRGMVRQIYWAVAPEASGAHATAFIVSSSKQHSTMGPDGVERAVAVTEAAAQVVHALPFEGTSVRRELIFLLHLAPTQVVGVREDGSQAFAPIALRYDLPAKDLNPSSLVAVPGTGLVGFNFAAYPQTAQLVYGRLTAAGATLTFEVKQELGSVLVPGKETEVMPARVTEARLLVRSGAQAATFDPSKTTPAWSQLNAQFTDMVHHPRKEIFFATRPTELLRYSYTVKPTAEKSFTLPSNLKVGVTIQP